MVTVNKTDSFKQKSSKLHERIHMTDEDRYHAFKF
jgi:hypothetical protein